jgi:Stigma-specific protein, Stig1
MRQSKAKGSTACAGMAVLGCFSLLAHCSSSSGGGDPPPGSVVQSADGGLGKDVDLGDASQVVVNAPPKCEANGTCSDMTLTCCNGSCVDITKDPNNCGQCGTACTADQFCTGKACDDAVISNVCANPNGTVAMDPYAEDNQAGSARPSRCTARRP